MGDDWSNVSDEELALRADRGLAGQGAIVEATRRLHESNVAVASATARLTSVIEGAKWVMIGVIATVLGALALRYFGLD